MFPVCKHESAGFNNVLVRKKEKPNKADNQLNSLIVAISYLFSHVEETPEGNYSIHTPFSKPVAHGVNDPHSG